MPCLANFLRYALAKRADALRDAVGHTVKELVYAVGVFDAVNEEHEGEKHERDQKDQTGTVEGNDVAGEQEEVAENGEGATDEEHEGELADIERRDTDEGADGVVGEHGQKEHKEENDEFLALGTLEILIHEGGVAERPIDEGAADLATEQEGEVRAEHRADHRIEEGTPKTKEDVSREDGDREGNGDEGDLQKGDKNKYERCPYAEVVDDIAYLLLGQMVEPQSTEHDRTREQNGNDKKTYERQTEYRPSYLSFFRFHGSPHTIFSSFIVAQTVAKWEGFYKKR